MKFVGANPNIWKFFDELISEESRSIIKFIRLENDILRSRNRAAEYVARDINILKCKNNYLQKTITMEEYIANLVNFMPNCDKVKK